MKRCGANSRVAVDRVSLKPVTAIWQMYLCDAPLVDDSKLAGMDISKDSEVRVNRKSHWDKVYGARSPQEVSWFQRRPTLSLELIRSAGIAHDAAIIDVGGGASVLTDRLIDEGFSDLTVLDLSGEALAHARKRLGSKAQSVNWIEADITEFNSPRSFMLWHDRAVLHFLIDEDDRQKYVAGLRRSLAPNGHVIIATFAIGGPRRCSGLDIVQYNADTLMEVLGSGFRLVDERTEKHLTPSGADQKFAWFHLVRS